MIKALPDGCVDAVITDPPYGNSIDTWQHCRILGTEHCGHIAKRVFCRKKRKR